MASRLYPQASPPIQPDFTSNTFDILIPPSPYAVDITISQPNMSDEANSNDRNPAMDQDQDHIDNHRLRPVTFSESVRRQAEEDLSRVEETRPLLGETGEPSFSEDDVIESRSIPLNLPLPIITRTILISPSDTTVNTEGELSQPFGGGNSDSETDRSTPDNFARLAAIIANQNRHVSSNRDDIRTDTTAPSPNPDPNSALTSTAAQTNPPSQPQNLSRTMTATLPPPSRTTATTSTITASVHSRSRRFNPTNITPGSPGNPQALLSSLHDLRSNLVERVESLGQEIDTLRRRAHELERDFVDRDDVIGSNGSRFPPSTVPRIAYASLGVTRATAISDRANSSHVNPGRGSTSSASQNSAGPTHQKRSGSGSAELEGDRLTRRAKRMEATTKREPETAATSPSCPASTTQASGTSPPIGASNNLRDIGTAPPNATRTHPALDWADRNSGRIPSIQAQQTQTVNDRVRQPDNTTRISERNRERRTGWDRARSSSRTLPSSVPDESTLTTRGLRVLDRVMADPSSISTDRQNQALPAGATDFIRSRWTSALTRYRDALVFGSHSLLPPTDSHIHSEVISQTPPRRNRTPSPSEITRTAAEATSSGIMSRLLEAARADALPPIASASTATATGEIGRAAGSEYTDRQRSLDALQNATDAMHELQVLAIRVSGLHDRLEAARHTFRGGTNNTADSTRPRSGPISRTDVQGRRPPFPSTHTVSHPHHRPRIGPDPIAAVINCDNLNSFDINFNGSIVFRPISTLEPNRELIARCLSMLPGGRGDTPSRWMRLTGHGSSRTRRPSPTAGFWVRWISTRSDELPGPHRRSMDMSSAPRIVAFDFSIIPPEDDPFVRADEVEFYTPRSRLRSNVGPWMHSRVRIAPFETDPPMAGWGTSAHVRQVVQTAGDLQPGDFVRYNVHSRSTMFVRGENARANSRVVSELNLTEQSNPNNDVQAPEMARGPVGLTDNPSEAWLMAFEPAVGQIRAAWRAHCRRHGAAQESEIFSGMPLSSIEEDLYVGPEGRDTPTAMWSRDFLDENGMPLRQIPLPTNRSEADATAPLPTVVQSQPSFH